MATRSILVIMGRSARPPICAAVLLAGAGMLAACDEVAPSAEVRTGSSSSAQPVPWQSSEAGPLSAVPLGLQPVSVRMLTGNRPARHGTRFTFIVRLLNRGGRDAALEPCPTYRVGLQKVVEVGTLNCRDAPRVIAAHGHIDFAMQVRVAAAPAAAVPLMWQLGGEGYEGATATAVVRVVG
jgi:hypothetical protein